MSSTRRTWMLGAGAAMLTACKRKEDPVVPEIWDEAPVPERAEALGRLAPPWPAPARGTLESGLLTYWLHDPGATTAHLRLFFPDHDGAPLPALATRSVATALQQSVQRGMGRIGGRVRQTRRVGRLELELSGPAQALPRMAAALARPLARSTKVERARPATLLRARTRVARDGEARTALDVATASTVAALLGVSMDSQRIDASRASTLDADALLDTWNRVLDPRRCVLVVHAPQTPDDMPGALSGFEAWTGAGRRERAEGSLARLRWTPPQAEGAAHLLVDGGAALQLPSEKVTNGASVVMGCRLQTPDQATRATARLAQRLLAESYDARLALCGPDAVFTINSPVSERSVEKRARALAEGLAAAGTERMPTQRLFTAAQLWLGARVVQASLDGEDWTALWSESMDLADTEADIPRALAADAAAMLSVQPKALTAWVHTQLDPKTGAAPWAWSLAGATDRMRRTVSRFASTKTIAPTA